MCEPGRLPSPLCTAVSPDWGLSPETLVPQGRDWLWSFPACCCPHTALGADPTAVHPSANGDTEAGKYGGLPEVPLELREMPGAPRSSLPARTASLVERLSEGLPPLQDMPERGEPGCCWSPPRPPPPPALTFLRAGPRASTAFLSTGKWTGLHLGFRVEPSRASWGPQAAPDLASMGRGPLCSAGEGNR